MRKVEKGRRKSLFEHCHGRDEDRDWLELTEWFREHVMEETRLNLRRRSDLGRHLVTLV